MFSLGGIIGSRSKVFVGGLISFFIGLVASYFFVAPFSSFVSCLVAIFLLIIFGRKRFLVVIFLWLIFFIFGVWRYQLSLPHCDDPGNVCFYQEKFVSLTGRVENPGRKITGQNVTFSVENIEINNERRPAGGKIIFFAGLSPRYDPGDVLRVSCFLKLPTATADFAYDRYLAAFDIYSVCSFPKVEIIAKRASFFGQFFTIKEKLLAAIARAVPEPQVSILQAMVLGERGAIPRELLDLFSKVGLSHIIAISGANITIIVSILMYLAIGLGIKRPQAFYLSAAGITFFILLIGDQPSATRAAVMGLVVLYAQKIGRVNNALNAILFSAFLMLIINPKLLLFDIGFELSFLAVIGLIYLSPIINRAVAGWPNVFGLREIIATTLAAQIMTLPLIIFYFKIISLVALLTNILVLPIISFVTIYGLVNILIATVSTTLGTILGWLSWLAISYIIVVSRLAAKLPFAWVEFSGLDLSLMILCYVVIFYFIYYEQRKSKSLDLFGKL